MNDEIATNLAGERLATGHMPVPATNAQQDRSGPASPAPARPARWSACAAPATGPGASPRARRGGKTRTLPVDRPQPCSIERLRIEGAACFSCVRAIPGERHRRLNAAISRTAAGAAAHGRRETSLPRCAPDQSGGARRSADLAPASFCACGPAGAVRSVRNLFVSRGRLRARRSTPVGGGRRVVVGPGVT